MAQGYDVSVSSVGVASATGKGLGEAAKKARSITFSAGETVVTAGPSLPFVEFEDPFKPGTVPAVVVQCHTLDSADSYKPLVATHAGVTDLGFSVEVRNPSTGALHSGDVVVSWLAAGEQGTWEDA